MYWWIDGQLAYVRDWMDEVVRSTDDVAPRTRAIALYFTSAIAFWRSPAARPAEALRESASLFAEDGDRVGEALALISLALALLDGDTPDIAGADEALETSCRLFREAGNGWGEAMALVTSGRVSILRGQVDAASERFRRSLALARAQGDALGQAIALNHDAWAELLLGRPDAARERFEENLTTSAGVGHDEGVAYGLEGLASVAAATGDIDRAGRLLGAADSIRERKGLHTAAAFTLHERAVEGILAGPSADRFRSARVAGRALEVGHAVAFALGRQTVPA